MTDVSINAINVYPVKSLAGLSLSSSPVTTTGLAYDRRFMLVDAGGEMITQREHPQLTQMTVALDGDLYLQTADGQQMRVPLDQDGPIRQVNCWEDAIQAMDCGDSVAKFLSSAFNMQCRLVRMDPQFRRLVPENGEALAAGAQAVTGFADAYPLLLISEESLADLNDRMEAPLPMNRFRPNVVVKGCEPFAEDTWKRIRIAGVILDVVKACERCVFTTVDQDTGQTGKEPLKTLATYRRQGAAVIFGMNLIHRNHGNLQLGDKVEILA